MFGDHIHAIGRHAAAIVTVRAPQPVIPTTVGMRAGGSIRDRFGVDVGSIPNRLFPEIGIKTGIEVGMT